MPTSGPKRGAIETGRSTLVRPQVAPGPRREDHLRFPVLQGVLPIDWNDLPGNIVAGITLAALAIPEVMGYTRIAGTPVITGLYTLLIPMALFAVFGSSRHLVVGADSATAAIVAGGLVGLAAPGSGAWLALAEVLALLAAVFLIIARLVGLGFLADFLSRTVLVGFLVGVGLQVALGEVGGMLGLPDGGRGTVEKLVADVRTIGQIHGATVAVSVAVLAVILGTRFISRRIPGALLAVVGAIAVSWAVDLRGHGVAVLGAIPSGMPGLGLPHVPWSLSLVERLAPTAFALFVVILAQSAATSRAYAARHNERLSENTDLVGLALANVGAAFSGTFVVNGSPTKTEMVDSAGGRSQIAQLTTTVLVVIVLLFLVGPLAYMPTAVLSAVVFLIGIDLIDVTSMRRIWRERPSEFWVALLTAAAVVFFGVERAILLAIVLSLLDHVRRGYHPHNVVEAPDARHGWHTAPVTSHAQARPGLVIYRFNHSLYYANTHVLANEVNTLATSADPPLAWLCLDATAVEDVDFTAASTLRAVRKVLQDRGARLVFSAVSEAVRDELDRYGITRLVGTEAFFVTPSDVVTAFDRRRSQRPRAQGQSGRQ